VGRADHDGGGALIDGDDRSIERSAGAIDARARGSRRDPRDHDTDRGDRGLDPRDHDADPRRIVARPGVIGGDPRDPAL
jgi:hypothetical protein